MIENMKFEVVCFTLFLDLVAYLFLAYQKNNLLTKDIEIDE